MLSALSRNNSKASKAGACFNAVSLVPQAEGEGHASPGHDASVSQVNDTKYFFLLSVSKQAHAFAGHNNSWCVLTKRRDMTFAADFVKNKQSWSSSIKLILTSILDVF